MTVRTGKNAILACYYIYINDFNKFNMHPKTNTLNLSTFFPSWFSFIILLHVVEEKQLEMENLRTRKKKSFFQYFLTTHGVEK